MKANETHISLETAKLLKDCGVESKYIYYRYSDCPDGREDWHIGETKKHKGSTLHLEEHTAYTWQEIMWEYTEEFFEEIKDYFVVNPHYVEKVTREILYLLQQKKYEESDMYFRENCILIKK